MPNSKIASRINVVKQYSLYFLLPILYLSYYPVLAIGATPSMNLEFSLPLIWLLLYSVLSLPTFFRFIKNIRLNFFSLSLLFPIFASLSVFWSPNKLRGILTAGVIWCLWITVYSIYDLFRQKPIQNNTKFKKNLLKIFFVSTILVCLFCWVQCVLDVVGVSRTATLLCRGCTSQAFGFPHPNGFAIEPQFMGNLLIAPTLLALFLLLKTQNHRQKIFLAVTSLFFAATLFLTFSRGAIYSFGIALAVFLVLSLIKHKSPRPLLILPLTAISFILTLSMQGVFAHISPTNDTFMTGVSKSINQLSLGLVNLDQAPDQQEPAEVQPAPPTSNQNADSTFDGYVEESTNTRLDLSALALKAWTTQPNTSTFLVGYGLGSAGTILNIYDDSTDSDKEIVQNEYLEIALELGLWGVILAGLLAIKILIILKNQNSIFLSSLLIAYGVSLCFFSGLPNALHIFLLPPLLFFILKDDFVISQISYKHTN